MFLPVPHDISITLSAAVAASHIITAVADFPFNIAVFSDCSGSCESDVLLVPITIDVSSVFNLQQEYNVSDSNKVTASLVRSDLTVVVSQVINGKEIMFEVEQGIYSLYLTGFLMQSPCSLPGSSHSSCFENQFIKITTGKWNFTDIIYNGPIKEFIPVDILYSLFPWSEVAYPWKYQFSSSQQFHSELSFDDSQWTTTSSWESINSSNEYINVRRSFYITSSQQLTGGIVYLQSVTPLYVYLNNHLLYRDASSIERLSGLSGQPSWTKVSFPSAYLIEGRNILCLSIAPLSNSYPSSTVRYTDCFIRFIHDDTYYRNIS